MSEAEDLVRDAWRRWNDGERELDPETFDPEIEIHSDMTRTVCSGAEGAGGKLPRIRSLIGPQAVEQATLEAA